MSEQKKKKSLLKRWWFWLIVVIIIIIIAVSAGGGGNSNGSSSNTTGNTTTSTNTKNTTSKTPTKTNPKIGQTVTVDKFQVKVNSVKYESKIPDDGTGMAPKANGGTWMIVNVTVKNNDTKGRTLDSSFFTVLKGSTQYNASSEADPFVNSNNNGFFLSQVNPGLSLTGNIAFNVPSKGNNYKLKVSSGFGGIATVDIDLKK